MRIQLTGTPFPEEDPEIIIHGKIPKAPEKSCQTCAVVSSCNLLSDAIKSIQVIGPMPKTSRPSRMRTLSGEIVEDTNPFDIMPLPMPCRGNLWQVKSSGVYENNPLIERLGLSNVGYESGNFYKEKEGDSSDEK